MADSGFSLDKVLGFLKKFLSSMESPVSGFNMKDAKVKEEGDIFSSLFSLESGEQLTDVGGNPIDINILLRADNFKSVFTPILDGINNLVINDADYTTGEERDQAEKGKAELLNVLLGSDRGGDISVAGARSRGQKGGLLGENLEQAGSSMLNTSSGQSFDGKSWSWGLIAYSYLSWSLECQQPGKEYGGISNQDLEDCGLLVGEYLQKVNSITSAEEVKVDITKFSLPILVRMQAKLIEYYEAALKKYNPTDVADESIVKEQLPQNLQAVFDKNGVMVDQIDINTDDGASKAEQYEAQGYRVGASKHIDVTLRKITGSTEFDMTAIRANYDPSLVLMDMDEIIDQPEFIDSLSEEPTTYAIDVDEDGFDIEVCEECMECSPCESLCEVFKAGIRAYRNLYIIHWMSNGNDMMKLHLMSEEMYEELIKEIDTIGELLVEKQGTVPQLDFPCDYVSVQDYDFQTGLEQIKSLIQMYIDCIDYAYPNQTSDVQSTLDEWIRYWNKQMNYFIKGQEE